MNEAGCCSRLDNKPDNLISETCYELSDTERKAREGNADDNKDLTKNTETCSSVTLISNRSRVSDKSLVSGESLVSDKSRVSEVCAVSDERRIQITNNVNLEDAKFSSNGAAITSSNECDNCDSVVTENIDSELRNLNAKNDVDGSVQENVTPKILSESDKGDNITTRNYPTEENKHCKILILDRNKSALEESGDISREHCKKNDNANCDNGDSDAGIKDVADTCNVENVKVKEEPSAEGATFDVVDPKTCDNVCKMEDPPDDVSACGSNPVAGQRIDSRRRISGEGGPKLAENEDSVKGNCDEGSAVAIATPDASNENGLEGKNTMADSCSSDIIPEDEATKICDALLQILSPSVAENEPEEKFIVSIKLDKLNKRIQPRRASRSSTRRISYASKQQTRFSRRNKEAKIVESLKSNGDEELSTKGEEFEKEGKERITNEEASRKQNSRKRESMKENLKNDDKKRNASSSSRSEKSKQEDQKNDNSNDVISTNEGTNSADSPDSSNEESNKEDHSREDSSEEGSIKEELIDEDNAKSHRKKLSKYKLLPKRTTRHSRPLPDEDVPNKLMVSISLDMIDSYCQDEDKPPCLLSTHTYSEGWMVQEEASEAERKKHFCIDDIFVDKRAFGVMKYRTVDVDGGVKEHLEILETKVAPANYIWPKDEDGRETGRLLVPDVMKDGMTDEGKKDVNEKDESKPKVDEDQGVAEKGSNREESVVVIEESLATDSGVNRSENEIEEPSQGSSSVFPSQDSDSQDVLGEATVDPVVDRCKEETKVNEGTTTHATVINIGPKGKSKQSKTKLKNAEKVSGRQTVVRKTRSQVARGKREETNEESCDASIAELKTSEDCIAIEIEHLSQTHPNLEESADDSAPTTKEPGCDGTELRKDSISVVEQKDSVAEPCDETGKDDGSTAKTQVDTGDADACVDNAEKEEEKRCDDVASTEVEKAKEQATVGDVVEEAQQEVSAINTKKRGRGNNSRRRKADGLMVGKASDSKKLLRPRRGQYQVELKALDAAEEKVGSEDQKDGNEVEIMKHSEPKRRRRSKRAGDVKSSDKVGGKNGEGKEPDKDVEVKEGCKESHEADELKKEKRNSTFEKEFDKGGRSAEDTATGTENSPLVDTVAKNDIEEASELKVNGDSVENADEIRDKDDSCDVKVIDKEHLISFTLDTDKSDVDSFQNSPARFQEEFSGIHPSSVSTSIMSSIATSLNSELFGMNSCDLEFTLPGMSKDVLVKANGSVVKSNEIEDCLRLPPADKKDDLDDMQQNSGMACADAVLNSEMRHGQSLLSPDMPMDCLSPYGDTSKFFNIHGEESSNGAFENGRGRIGSDFHASDAFLNGGDAGSPFQETDADVGLKEGDRIDRSTDKWDRVLMRNPDSPIDKSQITELLDDPFMNSDEIRSGGSHPDDSLLPEVKNFTENNITDSPCDDDKYDIPDSQFENVDLSTEGFECGQELTEDPAMNMSYAKEASEGYSSGSSTDEDDDEDEDSDSSETDTDSSSSSSSRSDDDDDDDEDDEDSEEEESESSDSESDVTEEIKSDEMLIVDSEKSGIPSPAGEVIKEPFTPLKIEEVLFRDDEILPIERKECREFFMGKLSKTPEKYLDIRKFIIKEWNKIRPAYLTKNSIRSKVDPTDANAVGRVFMFLENFGAINVGCSVKNKWVERMERRRVKYFNAKRTENAEVSFDEQKRKRGRPPGPMKESQGREVFLDFNVITEEERKANPQFFNGNKNKSPEKYLKMRNSIINCWMDSKPAYLTKQAARMAMSWYCGDVNAISRVHDYLEQIGAINFGCAQEPRRGRPSRARMNQERTKSKPKSKEFNKNEKEKVKTVSMDSKAARMKNAQKKLEDISREVALEIGKPVTDDDIGSFDVYRTTIHRPISLAMDKATDINQTKPKSKRGRKPKIRQCEPDSTVHDENLLNDKELVRPPKNGLIPVKEIWESGPASDKSSIGDSGFDSVSEISPLLESESGSMTLKASLVQDAIIANLEDENDEGNYPMPTEEKIIDISMITEEEKLGCPEFFVGSRVKPPEKYVKIRDSILRSWHNKKPFYLNKHNARCDMPWYTGDINSIGRVHAYLERIGAINYGAVHRPKRTGRVPMCRKRKLTDSPRYEAPSPETEDDDDLSDKLTEPEMCNDDLITREEREAFKRFLTDGNCINMLPSNRSSVRDVMSEMWAKCKRKYLTKSTIDRRYTEDYGNDDDEDDDDDNDSNSDTGDDTYIDNRTLMNGTYSETGKNGVWDMTKTFSLGLRPRKRWKLDINQDWIDRTESEGFTIKVILLLS